ncbi:50S ribosomal protein L6 [Halegenticoccus soli]|uniref:50S ribosomal protein L6 n=1 Tax=Halegenticoccus soli TaxID=1985678 RepID=UPI000C6EA6D0|nr:50S ribosomal protein L6 [Halegenticoccus soli]
MSRVEIEIPDDVSAEVDHLDLTVEGPNGSVTKRLWYPNVSVAVESVENDDGDDVEAVVVESSEENAKTNATLGTFESHVRNMIHGVSEGWEYRMEIYYAHFPMQVNVEGDEVVINNFLGEKSPRRTPVRGDTEVQVDGEEIVLSGPDKEAVGQTAADIEQLTRVTDKDTRVFQDGVYITEKPKAGGV